MNELIGISMALVIGVVCRVFNLPLPAPPNLQGSLLVLAVTLGFMAANYLS
ncbi:MAG: xapx domain-containing protein [Halobacteriovoraceae bacterium]|nr:xapx domain-containing protein [Halobacteriovoraceae bacterium]